MKTNPSLTHGKRPRSLLLSHVCSWFYAGRGFNFNFQIFRKFIQRNFLIKYIEIVVAWCADKRPSSQSFGLTITCRVARSHPQTVGRALLVAMGTQEWGLRESQEDLSFIFILCGNTGLIVARSVLGISHDEIYPML